MLDPRHPTHATTPVDVTDPVPPARHRVAEPEPDVRAMFDEFATRTAHRAPAVDLPGVRSRSSRRLAARWAVAAAAAAALVVPVAVYAMTRPAVEPPLGAPVGPTPEPPVGVIGVAPAATSAPAVRPQPTLAPPAPPAQTVTLPPTREPAAADVSVPPAATTPISGIDWRNATIQIPDNRTGCAAGAATFSAGAATVGASRYEIGGGAGMAPDAAYGDVDGDGEAEALVVVSCVTNPDLGNSPSAVLLLGAVPSLHTMTVVFGSEPRSALDKEGRSYVDSLIIEPDGTITLDVRTFEGNGGCVHKWTWTAPTLTGGCPRP